MTNSRPRFLTSVVAPALLLLATATLCLADEGMWTLDDFPKQVLKDGYGFEPTDSWLEHVRLSSARLGRGCSASFVSSSGLVMTNYHCVTQCIEELSTAESNLSRDGFQAATPQEERACSRVEVNQLLSTKDVTAAVQASTKDLSGEAFVKAQQAEMSRLEKECAEDGKYRCEVVTLYHGGRYHLYRYKAYQDVRLVFAPEFQTAFFGGDPDNFNFPRYNLDLAFLRVYENGAPARTEHHFFWSRAGAKEGELVFVAGHPGSTRRLLTQSQLEYLRDVSLPAGLMRSSEQRGLLLQFAKLGSEQRRIAADDLVSVENRLKGTRGRFEALTDKAAFEAKSRAERDLRARIAADPERQRRYGSAWEEIGKAQEAKRRLRVAYGNLEQRQGFDSDLYTHAVTLVRAAEELPKPNGERLRELRDSALPTIKQRLFAPVPVHKDLEMVQLGWSLMKLREEMGADHPVVKKVLGERSPDELARYLLEGSVLDQAEERKRLWDGGAAAVSASTDPMIRLAALVDPDARAVRRAYDDEVEAVEKKNGELIARAFFEDRGPGTYPDATSTLRVTFGTVRGFPHQGNPVSPFTDFAGLFARQTGREPFALPDRWLQAKGGMKLSTPFNFTADTDIIGGNSGSPIFNRNGEIVGLVFDGNIYSLGGDYWFDERVNRTVAVHSQGILEALRGVYRAEAIAKDLVPAPVAGQ